MASPPAAPPSRNAPCPCGSGLRYKHCCGRAEGSAPPDVAIPFYVGWDAFTQDEKSSLWATMQRALEAQKLGQLDAARGLYEEVVARAPLTFDAVHMLGVVRMQQGDLDDAEAMLTRALELAPGLGMIRHNLTMLRHRKQEHQGLYSASTIVAVDMLRLLGARGQLAAPEAATGFLPAGATDGAIHVVVPGDVLNGAANRSGLALRDALSAHGGASLWSDPRDGIPMARLVGARTIDVATGTMPRGGTLALFGISARTLGWLPLAADSFRSIVVALDAHDPPAYVELFDCLPQPALRNVRVVARSAEVLADLGLPGAVDALLFGEASRGDGDGELEANSPRIGVFIPPLRDREDKARWDLLEWLRARGAFLRLLYPGPLPSRHVPDEDEHLISLVTEWDGWTRGLDALFFWGAEGRMRQYDRLVFEALSAGLRVVADGFGDFGGELARRDDCALFFDAQQARSAVERMLLPASPAIRRAEVPL